MQTKVQKWGNSLAVRIPKAYAEQLGLTVGGEVRIIMEADRLVIKAVRQVTLEELLADVTPDNVHTEMDWGASVGNEGW